MASSDYKAVHQPRYAAFISYAHADARWATRLHRQLESYRVPPLGPDQPRTKLGRVFLDRSEFSSSSNLSEAIQAALDDSDSLIVVCSPSAAASRWVNEEVRRFRDQGRGNRIFCLIVGGDPAGLAAPNPFPPALLETRAGEPTPEPLAADVRPNKDKPSDAILKIIAGVMGVPYDALRRRDLVRRQRRLAALATVSTVLLIIMTGLTIAAMLARREAERQRDTAVRTATFMRAMFDQARPDAGGADVTVRTMLERSTEATLHDPLLQNEPETRADLLTTLAQVFAKLGAFDRSEALLKAATLPDDRDSDRLISQAALAAELSVDRSDYTSARRIIDAALARRGTGTAEDKGQRVRLLTLSGEVWNKLREPDRAQADFERARALSLASSPPDRSSAVVALTAAALADVDAGNLDRAQKRLLKVISERRALGQPRHPNVLTAINSLGALAIKRGDAPTAERYFRQAIALQREVLGDQHLDTATSRSNLGRALVEQRKFEEAKKTLESARATFIAQAGPRFDSLANLDDSLGLAQSGLGDAGAARTSFAEGLQIARDHQMPKEIELLTDRAELECRDGHPADGLRLAAQSRAALHHFQLPEPWRAARIDAVEGGCLIANGQPDAAAPLLRRATSLVVKRWGRGSLFGTNAVNMAARLKKSRSRGA